MKQFNNRLNSLDFLRGLAIISVIAVHTSHAFPSGINEIDIIFGYGRFGVQLFYFISGFTMCYIWILRKNENNSIRNFYIRRFFRIAPLFWLAIPIYIIINGIHESYWAPDGIKLKQIILTATFLHGFWPDSINSIVPGGWSIAVEIIFYLIFPILVLTIKDRAHIYLISGLSLFFLYNLILKQIIYKILIQNYSATNINLINDFLYFNFLNQAPIFLIGCFMFFAKIKYLKKYTLIFIFWIFFLFIYKDSFSNDAIKHLIVYTLIGSFFYFIIKKKFTNNIIQDLGKNSYCIYLNHFLVIKLLQNNFNFHKGLLNLMFNLVLITIISYLISIIIYRLIEKKIFTLTKKITKNL